MQTLRLGLTTCARATKKCAGIDLGKIVIHPFIIGELALGFLKDRTRTLALLNLLPQAPVARLSERRLMIEARRLYITSGSV